MRSLTQISVVCAAGIAAAGLLVSGALASHGKAGLWSITTKMEMPGMPQMPDMSQMPPEVRERMKAMNMNMSNKGMTIQHCMTQAEVDQDGPPPMARKECKLVGSKIAGHTYAGDVACAGSGFNGTGHFEVTYESSEHYTGSMDMKGSHDGQPMNMHSTYEGQWVSASCGSVTH
jgi:Protein of unknown function (DUF3617)